MGIEYFERLGRTIETRWSAVHQNEDRFAEIALEMLTATPGAKQTSPTEILRYASKRGNLGQQLAQTSAFGSPPITMFHSMDGFVIDVYFWFEGTTAIHQHGFSGAFQVLSGSSLHSTFTFDVEEKVNARFLLGSVCQGHAETLRVGDTRRILSGTRFAHALFHLDTPSTTIVVRTGDDDGAAPQLEYRAPHIAFDPFNVPRRRVVSLEALQALRRMDFTAYAEASCDALALLPLEESYFLLQGHIDGRRSPGETDDQLFGELLDIVRTRHGGAVAGKFEATLTRRVRGTRIAGLRARSSNPEHRFLLAVLLNALNRAQVVEFVASRYPKEEPAAKFVALIAEMIATKVGDSNALGIELSQEALGALQLVVEGCAPDALPETLVRRGLASQEAVDELLDDLLDFRKMIAQITLLEPILQ